MKSLTDATKAANRSVDEMLRMIRVHNSLDVSRPDVAYYFTDHQRDVKRLVQAVRRLTDHGIVIDDIYGLLADCRAAIAPFADVQEDTK